jgi:hypothetical protein
MIRGGIRGGCAREVLSLVAGGRGTGPHPGEATLVAELEQRQDAEVDQQ